MGAKTDALVVLACLFLARPDVYRDRAPGRARTEAREVVDSENQTPATDPSLLVDDAPTLKRLEANGYALRSMVSGSRWAALTKVLQSDVDDFTAALPPNNVRRVFRTEWLTRGRFELIGVVNRFDRRAFRAQSEGECGEVRLVYRLALQNPGRPKTRLPMTINLRIPQAPPANGDCSAVARAWRSNGDVGEILRALPPFTRLETNFQSTHVPSYRTDMDDTADYAVRSFRVEGGSLVPDTLFNTPREDLNAAERAALQTWIVDNLAAIDRGSAVVPEKFLATRAVSVSPRGLVHRANTPFSRLFGEPEIAPAIARAVHAASSTLKLSKTPELLLRRLDEATCVGCHQSRTVAGFHLLGEEREGATTFNALAIGHSAHVSAELHWRRQGLADAANGITEVAARPFSSHPDNNGAFGSECGIARGFQEWTCAPGLVCRDIHHADVGICAPPQGSKPGEPCEDVHVTPDDRSEGALITSSPPDPSCPAISRESIDERFCAPNWLGFTGGMCSVRCPRVGDVSDGSICAPLPAQNYEADCFYSREPIESCLQRHFVSARIVLCDAEHPCRSDYACARVPSAPEGVGACVPPYFVFQVRVDGPILDR